ncbi:MAG: OsmC family protein [Gammaproteobacteria bacterium]|nr:OsmC family protein [Gammaproteobacteria bacterium]
MGKLNLAYQSRSYSSGTLGRALCNARTHHWVADDSGGEAVGAGELFCAGVAACAVNMVERIADTEDRPLGWMDVSVGAYRDPDAKPGDVTLYDAVRVKFEMWGVDEDDAKYLVKTWKQR